MKAPKKSHSIMDYPACQRDYSWCQNSLIKQLIKLYFEVEKSTFQLSFSDRGSRNSRNPSPKKLNDKIVKNIASEGNKIKCG